MAINTTFTSGAILTAAQMNNLPWGVAGLQTLTTTFNTVPTHTVPQPNGMTLTITEVTGRRYRITAYSNIYPSGGLQGMNYGLYRAGSLLKQGVYASTMLSAASALPISFTYTYTATSSGSATYTAAIWAATLATAVSDYGDSSGFPRQFVIEDIGPS